MEQSGVLNGESVPQHSVLSTRSKLPLLQPLNSWSMFNTIASSVLSFTKKHFQGAAITPSPSSILVTELEQDYSPVYEQYPCSAQTQDCCPAISESNQSCASSTIKASGSNAQLTPFASRDIEVSGEAAKDIAPGQSPATAEGARLLDPGSSAFASNVDSMPISMEENVEEIYSCSPGPIEKLYAISQIVFRGREGGTRHKLRRYMSGENANIESEMKIEEVTNENDCLEHSLNRATTAVTDVSAAGQKDAALLCQCSCCLRERELRWQLFLLKEEQRLNAHTDHIVQVPRSPTVAVSLSGQHSLPLQASSQHGKYVHNFASKVVYTTILIAHATYPHIKNFVKEIVSYEEENKVLERLVRSLVILMTRFYQITLAVIIRLVLLAVGKTEAAIASQLSRRPQDIRDQDVDQAKHWLASTTTQLISGACEGVELGLDACRQRNLERSGS